MESFLLGWFAAASGSPFFLMVPVLMILGLVALAAVGRPKLVALPALLLVMGIACYPAALLGAPRVHAWIAKTGAQGEVVFSRLEPTGNTYNHVQELRWVGTMKLASGALRDLRLPTHAIRTWPATEEFTTVASTPYAVRYRPAYPDLFVIEVKDAGLIAQCAQGRRQVQDLLTQLLIAEGVEKGRTAAELAALQATLLRCPP